MTDIAHIRRRYAEELRERVPIKSQAIVEAFATVPREAFLDPGPWLLRTELGRVQTPDADPAHIYRDVLVPLDEEKELNNGSPSLWAELFEVLNVKSGDRIVHIGGGRGYYTAILAELAGPNAKITCIEIDPRLARCAREALVSWPQVDVMQADGFSVPVEGCDVIVLSAGVSRFPSAWVRALRTGGRIMLPLTVDGVWPAPGGEVWRGGWGQILLLTKHGEQVAAHFVRPCGFTNCVSGHTPEIDERLRAAFAGNEAEQIRSLQLPDQPPDETCWFDSGDWWLSKREPLH